MCLAVPAKIIELEDTNAVVDLEGVRMKANVAFIQDAAVGDYVLVHAGFAIRKWSEEDVLEYQKIIASAGSPGIA